MMAVQGFLCRIDINKYSLVKFEEICSIITLKELF